MNPPRPPLSSPPLTPTHIHDHSRRLSIARKFGMDGISGAAQPSRNRYEECFHCRALLSTVLVTAYRVNSVGQPTSEITADGYRTITCMKDSCISRTRSQLRLKLKVDRIWMGNPFETQRVIAENAQRALSVTASSSATRSTTSPGISVEQQRAFRRN